MSQRCPTCGGDTNPEDHKEDCLRNDTCGQFGPPWLAEPWHRQDPELPSLLALQKNNPELTRQQWEIDYQRPWMVGLEQHLAEVAHNEVARLSP